MCTNAVLVFCSCCVFIGYIFTKTCLSWKRGKQHFEGAVGPPWFFLESPLHLRVVLNTKFAEVHYARLRKVK